jgi:4-amino-4-deoxy-L-arabinose transferase-like glycosyltransferase
LPAAAAHSGVRSIVSALVCQVISAPQSARVAQIGLALAVGVAALAPLGPLAANRFHHDEAVYSRWALDIASGRDIMVSGSPVDKPPLFLYLQALSFKLLGATETAARLPSLLATLGSVIILYHLGRRLFGRGTALLAAFLLAVSPYSILFAATAFTDPLMVTCVLAATLAAVEGRWGWSGVGLGLAFMTKQQGLLFVPLVVGLGLVGRPAAPAPDGRGTGAQGRQRAARFLIGLVVVAGLALVWDVARGRHPGFLEQSLLSYNPLAPQWEQIGGRLSGYLGLLRYATGSPLLNAVLVVGLPLLVLADGIEVNRGVVCPPARNTAWPEDEPARPAVEETIAGHRSAAAADLVLVAFVGFYLLAHTLLAFQVWDRYLLGLVPLLALLLARLLILPWRAGRRLAGIALTRTREAGLRGLYAIGLVVLTVMAVARPLQDAAASRFPIGGDHGAYDGVDQVVAYFKTVPADTTLYHRWLGAHWRFYLWGSPYDFRAWTSADDLATQAAGRPGARRYVVFPSWRSATEARLALESRGLALREVFRTLRRDGSVSFIVYRIAEASETDRPVSPQGRCQEQAR